MRFDPLIKAGATARIYAPVAMNECKCRMIACPEAATIANQIVYRKDINDAKELAEAEFEYSAIGL